MGARWRHGRSHRVPAQPMTGASFGYFCAFELVRLDDFPSLAEFRANAAPGGTFRPPIAT